MDTQRERIRRGTWFAILQGVIAFSAYAALVFRGEHMSERLTLALGAVSVWGGILALIEFAVILPSTIVFIVGVIWLAFAGSAYSFFPMSATVIWGTWFFALISTMVGIVGMLVNLANKYYSPAQANPRPFLGEPPTPENERVLRVLDIVILPILFLVGYFQRNANTFAVTAPLLIVILLALRRSKPKTPSVQ